jgi:hypothetical protein
VRDEKESEEAQEAVSEKGVARSKSEGHVIPRTPWFCGFFVLAIEMYVKLHDCWNIFAPGDFCPAGFVGGGWVAWTKRALLAAFLDNSYIYKQV